MNRTLPTLLTAATLLLAHVPAMATEEPDYRVLRESEAFELRHYAPYLVAETTVEGGFDEAGSRAFGILASYIFGDNRQKQKLEMTAPVNQRPAEAQGGSERIEMTAPVAQRRADARAGEGLRSAADGDRHVLSFVMPERFTLETLPVPSDPRVTLRRVPARLVAARRYSGRWTEANYRRNERALLEALREAGLTPVGTPVYARYNAPFSLWPLRRNEVLIEVAPPD